MVGIEVENSKGCIASMDSDHLGVRSKLESHPSPDPAVIAEDFVSIVEESAEQVLNCVHPTLDSEEKRGDVIDYIQQLVKNRLLCEVVSYGSVPLKTYLPEGDIDFTVLKGHNVEETLMHEILAILQEEERNENAEYEVRETQFIDAEVKIVKCIVRNIIIDISCNQIGGLSTLCFLEQVDRFIGRNHLFKRSIILVKTWCYYESRILGAHHGLISTYALETLVLYIFHFFHSSLSGPLSVLHKFLDYYSQFDWENYCISLKGPVRKSSLPDIVVDFSAIMSNNPLLSEEFMKSCTEMFSTSCKELEGYSKPFQIKHLNIVDPLKENNNLGRSVNRGNFYRIQSALKYGSYKLGLILSQSREEVANGIRVFFANTYQRHEHRNECVIRSFPLDIDDEESLTACISSPAVLSSDDDIFFKSYNCDLDNDSVSSEPEPISGLFDEVEKYTIRDGSVEIASESCSGTEEAGDKSSFGASNSSFWGGANDDLSSGNYSTCRSENRFYETPFSVENSSIEFNQIDSEKFHFTSWLDNRHGFIEMIDLCGFEHSEATYTTSSSSVTKMLESLDCRELDSISIDDDSQVLDALADLTGDYDNHIRSLLRAQFCYGSSSMSVLSSPVGSQYIKPWDVLRRSMPLGPMSSRVNYQFEWNKKAKGIGTYFPKLDRRFERPSHRGEPNKAVGNRNPRFAFNHSNALENTQLKVHSQRSRCQGRTQKSEAGSKSPNSVTETKGCLVGSCRIEFGSLGSLGEEMISRSSASVIGKQGISKGVSTNESLERPLIRLDEKEFPPLPMNCVSKPYLACIR